MTQTEPRRFEKTVAIKATDEDERTATGAALVPNEVDRQRDYLTPDGIEAMFAPNPDDGVMHFKFADDDAELVRNEIIDETETIGGKEYAAGSWIIKRKYHDDELWQLVKDGVLTGFSIGGEVSEDVERSLDELGDEVTFPAEVEPGPATEIVNGYVAEISDVDIPAVPNADHAAVKSLAKNIVAQATDEDEFVEMMEPRGHTEGDARRLWSHLQKTKTNEMNNKTDDSDGASLDDVDDATLGKRFKEFFFGSDLEESDTDSIELTIADPLTATKALTIAKEGRTLSQDNRETLMAAHDAVEAALASDMDFETNRFTDNDEYSFDIAQYGDKDEKSAGAEVEKLTEEQGDLVAAAIQRFIDAQGDASFGEFCTWLWQTDAIDDDTAFAADEAVWQYRDAQHQQMEAAPIGESFAAWAIDESNTDTQITMSDDTNDADVDKSADDPMADAPEWAKAIHEQTEKNADRLSEIEGDDEATKAIDDAPDWAKAIHEQTEKNAERIDAVAKGTADSDQIEAGAGNDDAESEGLDKVASLLG